MAAVEKSPKQRRHERTARDFQRWLVRNPEASLARRVGAFNAIADSNYKKRKNTPQKSKKK